MSFVGSKAYQDQAQVVVGAGAEVPDGKLVSAHASSALGSTAAVAKCPAPECQPARTMTGYDANAGAGFKAAVEHLVCDWPAVTGSLLFGFPAYRAEDSVFAVIDSHGVALARLPESTEDQLAANWETGPFTAYGQTIDRWVYVEATVDDLEALGPFVRESYETALSGTAAVPPPTDHPDTDPGA